MPLKRTIKNGYNTDNDVFLADNVILADISVLFADIMTFFSRSVLKF